MIFGEVLRDLLDESGLSQKQLAAKLNIAPSTLGNYVRNEREPDFKTLKRFAEFFNVTVDYLLDNRTAQGLSRAETELLRVFRTLTTEHQQIYIEQGKAFSKKRGES
ncbi:MAG: helix-turn-helix domain-containing protein [Oscillospiraceae bacterium]|jgi:transcriptional regulator with XRE-family HTH domain|nr:helix-turn-helix domain-containing protein [Oscillospiraceae bacterium]